MFVTDTLLGAEDGEKGRDLMFPNSLSLGERERDGYSISDNDLLAEKAIGSGGRGGRKRSQSTASSLQVHSFPSTAGWPSRFYISTLQRWTPGFSQEA